MIQGENSEDVIITPPSTENGGGTGTGTPGGNGSGSSTPGNVLSPTGVTAIVGEITQGSEVEASGTIGGITYTVAGPILNDIYIQQIRGGISDPNSTRIYENPYSSPYPRTEITVKLATNGTPDPTITQPADGPALNTIIATNASIKQTVESDSDVANLVDVAITPGEEDDLATEGTLTLTSGIERRFLRITHGADEAGIITVTVKGTPYTVNVAAGDNVRTVASKIADALNGNIDNYTVTAPSTSVIFTSTISGNVEDLTVTFE